MVLPTINQGGRTNHGSMVGRPGARDPDTRAGGTRGTLAIFTPSSNRKLFAVAREMEGAYSVRCGLTTQRLFRRGSRRVALTSVTLE